MVNKLHKKCALCGDLDNNLDKLRNGFLLRGQFICGQCQRGLSSSTAFQDDYFFYKEQIRKILF